MYYNNGEASRLRRRLGSESDKSDGSYVVSAPGSGFTVTQENATPHLSPNPRSQSNSAFNNSNGNFSKMMSASSRDRTLEFRNTVQSLRGRQMNGGVAGRRDAARHNSDFINIAKSISGDITNTYTKLEKLTLLCKRKTIFDDKPVEIQELTYIIKHDIANLNKQIGQLQNIAKAQRTAQGQHQQSHSSGVVVQLQSKLASMSNNFKQVLEVRTENLKSQKSRAEQFSVGGVTTSLPQSVTQGYHSGSVLAMEDDMSAGGGGDAVIDMGGAMGGQMMVTQDNDSYYASRADAMHTIESTIVELGGIFTQLAHMVKEQQEMVERIDSNVEDTALNVELGHNEILKYFQSVTSNRWLMVKIFGVLIFFFLIFVIFMA